MTVAVWSSILLALTLSHSAQHSGSWPRVRPVDTAVTFVDVGTKGGTPLILTIRDAANQPVYRLECHDGDYDGDAPISFSGIFQCALFALDDGKIVSGNLLAADDHDERSTDWFNRGRMIASQLRGRCASIPEFGTVRHFRMRGMRMTLRFSDIRWSRRDPSQLDRLTVSVTITPDPSATTHTAAMVRRPAVASQCERG